MIVKQSRGHFTLTNFKKVNPDEDRIYKIEMIIAAKGKGRKKQLLVKRHGFPQKFNIWIEASQVQDV